MYIYIYIIVYIVYGLHTYIRCFIMSRCDASKTSSRKSSDDAGPVLPPDMR